MNGTQVLPCYTLFKDSWFEDLLLNLNSELNTTFSKHIVCHHDQKNRCWKRLSKKQLIKFIKLMCCCGKQLIGFLILHNQPPFSSDGSELTIHVSSQGSRIAWSASTMQHPPPFWSWFRPLRRCWEVNVNKSQISRISTRRAWNFGLHMLVFLVCVCAFFVDGQWLGFHKCPQIKPLFSIRGVNLWVQFFSKSRNTSGWTLKVHGQIAYHRNTTDCGPRWISMIFKTTTRQKVFALLQLHFGRPSSLQIPQCN